MPTPSTDVFANYAIIDVTESGANTLTFKKLETGISLNEKVAWIINRLEYWLSAINVTVFDTNGDQLTFGLAVSNSFSTPAISEQSIIDFNGISRRDNGTPATSDWYTRPQIKDFATLPGGGILVPPVPLYLWAKGTGLTAACQVTARMHYTLRKLAVDEYWELVEARRVLSS
jgi:hypothetical protein